MPNRWFAKIWLILAALLIAACSSSSEIGDTHNKQLKPLQGNLVLWFSLSKSYLVKTQVAEFKQAIRASVQQFTRLHPDVKIVLEFTQDKEVVEKFVEQVEKGLGPDLIHTQSLFIPPLIQAGALRSLNNYPVEISKFRPDALSQVRYQGKLYGLPLYLNTQVLCYNKDKVKQLPQTLSDLIAQARAGYSVGLISRFEDAFWGTQIFGGQLFDARGRIVLDLGGGWARWMEWLKAAKDEPNFILTDDPIALQEAFIQGRLAYATCYSVSIPYLRESLGQNKFGVTLLPGEANRPAGPPLITQAILFSSVSSPAQTQLALRFAQFLTNPEQQREVTSKLQAVIPANKDAIIDPRLFPIQGILQKQSRTVRTFSLDEGEKLNAIIDYGNRLYPQVLAGEITPDAAAAQLTRTINAKFGLQ